MHSRDRYWRGMFLGPIALVLIAAVLIVMPESLMTFVEQINWTSLQTYSNLWPFIGLSPVWIGMIVISVRAQKRERRRARALAGDTAAMPLASDVLQLPSLASTSVTTLEPLTLCWGDGSVIIATAEGLRWQRPKKQDIFIPWHKAHLFEVWEGSFIKEDEREKTWKAEIFEYGFCLYASMRKYIEWTDAPTGSTDGEQLSWEQKDHLQQVLLTYISARTQLPLRVVRQVPAKETLWWRLYALAMYLIIAAFPVVTAILALTVPLTNTLALNIYVALLCGG